MRAALRTACLLTISLSAAGAPLLLPGCAGGPDEPRIGHDAYRGPRIRVDSTGTHHVAVLTAPTSGWGFRFDRARPALDGHEVFVTVTRPDPAYVYTQALVEQHVGTGIPSTAPFRLYARIVDHRQDPDDAPYRPVEEVEGPAPEPPR